MTAPNLFHIKILHINYYYYLFSKSCETLYWNQFISENLRETKRRSFLSFCSSIIFVSDNNESLSQTSSHLLFSLGHIWPRLFVLYSVKSSCFRSATDPPGMCCMSAVCWYLSHKTLASTNEHKVAQITPKGISSLDFSFPCDLLEEPEPQIESRIIKYFQFSNIL